MTIQGWLQVGIDWSKDVFVDQMKYYLFLKNLMNFLLLQNETD